VKVHRKGCFSCGGPCTTPCVDNKGRQYLGCDYGCRFPTMAEMEAMNRPQAVVVPVEPRCAECEALAKSKT
jgi:hypothetical protein